jgi:hypothetical protein
MPENECDWLHEGKRALYYNTAQELDVRDNAIAIA